MSSRFILALPLLVGLLALGNAAHAWPLALALAGVVLLLALSGLGWELDLGRQLLTSAIGAGAGYLLASLLYEPEPGHLREGWTLFAAAAFLGAAARFVILSARGGYLPSVALAFAGMAASGKTRAAGYPVLVVCFLLAVLWALAQRPGSITPRAQPRRAAFGALLLLVAAGLGLGTTLGLQKLHAWAGQRARLTGYKWRPQVGFSDRMDLGSLEGLLDSEKRVLRLRGPRVDYLRGASFDRYDVGRWQKSEVAEPKSKATFGGELPPGEVVEISAISERTGRFFLPLSAKHILTTPPTVLVDDMGSIERESRRGEVRVRFIPGARQRARLAPPRASDLQLPRRPRARIEALAATWTLDANTPAEKLDAIARHLRTEYVYARAFTRPSGVDPILDFLFDNPRGHCEYFATALALVARGAGVPTRMVMGYRVAERSPFGYHVVRERNAHAWVEAWLPGTGWTTHDATPEAALPQNREHDASYAASTLDALGVAYDDATDWLGRMTLTQTSFAWVLGSLLLAAIVARGARKRGARAPLPPDQAVLPFLKPLLDELARAGHVRQHDETLESLAARLSDASSASLIRRYAAFRYGGHGDVTVLAREVTACARARRRERRRAPLRGLR